MESTCLILEIFGKIYWEYFNISSQIGLAIFTSFWNKLFSCIIAKRAGFEDLVMS